ncbi:MAG: hypothetical protein WDM79_08535 [Terricaulis sp.]
MAIRASRLAFGAALASVAAAQAASAAPDLFSGDQLRGFIDFRAAASDSEQSWTDDGFGKTRFSGDDGDVAFDGLAQGMLIWRPHLTWNVDGYVTLQADTEGRPAIDVVEAFASYRGAPSDGWRFSGRAGLMYPPVSLEHDGPGWTPTDTITPSAINSWIGEEVKIVGVEASARRRFETQEFAATLGLFGFNDTSGTLLAYRGWALGDLCPARAVKSRCRRGALRIKTTPSPPPSSTTASAIMRAWNIAPSARSHSTSRTMITPATASATRTARPIGKRVSPISACAQRSGQTRISSRKP